MTKIKPDTYYLNKMFQNIEFHESGCWNWKRAINKGGYGQTCYNSKQVGSHWLMIKLFGRHIDGLVVDHTCKNKKCCNPFHLRMISNYENTIGDNSDSPPAINKRKTHCKRGHPFDTINTLFVKNGKGTRRRCRTCIRANSANQKLRNKRPI